MVRNFWGVNSLGFLYNPVFLIFNLQIIEGEYPQNTTSYQRLKSDLGKCQSILTNFNREINSQSVNDCFCLGKYKNSPIILILC